MTSDTQGGYSVFHGTMADMTYPEVKSAADRGAVVLWGLGVIEQHGPHLPLATDVYIPHAMLRIVGERLAEHDVASIVMPPFYWGINDVSALFPGTFTLRPEIMVEVMVDLLGGLKKDGFRRLYCVSGHGDAKHNRTILQGLKKGAAQAGLEAYFVGAPSFFRRLGFAPDEPHTLATDGEVERKSKFADVHAGQFETSSMWHFFPTVVRTEIVPGLKPTNLGPDELAEWRKGPLHAQRITPDGYLGDPAAADPGFGESLLKDQARLVADAIAADAKRQEGFA